MGRWVEWGGWVGVSWVEVGGGWVECGGWVEWGVRRFGWSGGGWVKWGGWVEWGG